MLPSFSLSLRRPARLLGAVFAIAALGSSGCKHKPSDHTPEGTLALLRDSLATHNPPITRVADLRITAEATALVQTTNIQNQFGLPASTSAFQRVLAEHDREMTPEVFFAGYLPLLRQGNCVRVGDAPVPDIIHPPPEPGQRWPASLHTVQQSVARRAQGAVAGDYRCDGGPSFGAAFVHPIPNDGTWRVAWMGPSRHP